MKVRGAFWRVTSSLSVTATLVALIGVAPVLDPDTATSGNLDGPHVVMALGDSVPSGAACSCTPFPQVYGSLLRDRTGLPVRVENYAVSGLDAQGLLAQVRRSRVAEAVRRADVFLITIGANDFEGKRDQVVDEACTTGGAHDCVTAELDSLRLLLSQVLTEIRTVRRGKPTSVLVTGYWNVYEDGDVGRKATSAAGFQATLGLTRAVNTTIHAVATTFGVRFVDLFEPFHSRGHAVDALLAEDGNHPDAAGHRLIATTLLEAGLPPARWSSTPPAPRGAAWTAGASRPSALA